MGLISLLAVVMSTPTVRGVRGVGLGLYKTWIIASVSIVTCLLLAVNIVLLFCVFIMDENEEVASLSVFYESVTVASTPLHER